ncbi:response regulator [Reinekea marinisedimentorum]|uniref:Two-component system response regulator BaeR n=1 Tax=Reinekea marinisedimentorum TaxID=230495 RepID=A0A4V6NXZ9_9GAMM|nr:response regulator [Reinekea marinisedimentorum]TCS37670.1 two-component system response regulator BaeR [Reinekea marinisedimentorum]
MSHILIVEDESHLADLERDYLKQAGFDVTVINRGDEAAQWLQKNEPDLVVLDLMLPGKDGLDICRDLRKSSELPVIMTTAKVEEVDRLIGLEIGADDYLCKPFSLRELVARVKAVLRRYSSSVEAESQPQSGQLVISENDTRACFGKSCTELTIVEVRLLMLLRKHPRQIFSRDQIIDGIYDDRRVVSDRTVDSHIKKLRKKLQEINPEHNYIQSVYGAGYRYDAEEI